MSISEFKQAIEKDLLLKSKTQIKVKKFDKCEELEIYYKNQGFETQIGQDLNGVYVLTVSFKNIKR